MYKPTKKRKRFHIWKCHVTMTKKERISLYGNVKWQSATKISYISNQLQLLNQSLSFIVRNYSLHSAASILFRSPRAYITTASLNKLTCTDYGDFGKSQGRFGQFSWTRDDSNYLDKKLKVFAREDKNAELWLRKNFTMGEADFNQFIRQRC